MEEVFRRMRSLVLAAFPLLPELVASPSPGEKLAGIAVLETFANADYFPDSSEESVGEFRLG